MAANIGLSKVFILDKYFKELQKFWETEKKLQGTFFFFEISITSEIYNTTSEMNLNDFRKKIFA